MKPHLMIEYPMVGANYREDLYGVYQYDEYPPGTVLAGQERRVCLDSFESRAKAQREYPTAQWADGSCYEDRPIPRAAPEWLDPLDIGETWDDSDENIGDGDYS